MSVFLNGSDTPVLEAEAPEDLEGFFAFASYAPHVLFDNLRILNGFDDRDYIVLDDFENGLKNWNVVRDRLWYPCRMANWLPANRGYLPQALLQGFTTADGVFSYDVKLDESIANPTSWCGFLFRLGNSADFWDQSGYMVFLRKNGEMSLFDFASSSEIGKAYTGLDPTSGYVNVRIELDGPNLGVYFNNSELPVLEAELPDCREGSIGFAVDDATARVDNLKFYQPSEGIVLSLKELSLPVGESRQLQVDILDPDVVVSDLVWESTDPSIASVSEAGVVTAVGEGSAQITVKTADARYTASCAVTVTRPSVQPTVPAAPSSVKAGEATRNSISLSWASSQDAQGYRVEYRAAGETVWKNTDDVSRSGCVIGGLLPGTSYEFRVSAYNAQGFSDYSGAPSAPQRWPLEKNPVQPFRKTLSPPSRNSRDRILRKSRSRNIRRLLVPFCLDEAPHSSASLLWVR